MPAGKRALKHKGKIRTRSDDTTSKEINEERSRIKCREMRKEHFCKNGRAPMSVRSKEENKGTVQLDRGKYK